MAEHLSKHVDLVIDTDEEGWSMIIASPKGRAAISALIDWPIDWDYDAQDDLAGYPAGWRIVEVNLASYERGGYAERVPRNDSTPQALNISLRWGIGAPLAVLSFI